MIKIGKHIAQFVGEDYLIDGNEILKHGHNYLIDIMGVNEDGNIEVELYRGYTVFRIPYGSEKTFKENWK